MKPLRLSLSNFLCYRENAPTLDFIINYDVKYRMGRDGMDEDGWGTTEKATARNGAPIRLTPWVWYKIELPSNPTC